MHYCWIIYSYFRMGCAPTNRIRSTTPIADAKPQGASIVHVRAESEKENITSIENIHQLGNEKQSKGSRTKGKIVGKGIDPFNGDIIVKEERRGAIVEKMNFAMKEHLQG